MTALQRQARQVQARYPAFRAPIQFSDRLCAECQLHNAAKKLRRLRQRKAEFGSANLQELAPCPQSRQRQRRVRTRDNHKAQSRHMLQEKRHCLVDTPAVDHMIIVKHQHTPPRVNSTPGQACPGSHAEAPSVALAAAPPHSRRSPGRRHCAVPPPHTSKNVRGRYRLHPAPTSLPSGSSVRSTH